jgi:hypothetical protein
MASWDGKGLSIVRTKMDVLEIWYQVWSGLIQLRIVVIIGYYKFGGFVMKPNSMTDKATITFSTCYLLHGFNKGVILPKY